jgi:hypothetical protein
MADYVPGKRGEPKRLAKLYGVEERQVRKWIEQLRRTPPRGSEAVPDTWRAVVEGQMLREQCRLAGRQRHKPKI